jgi:transcriptional regulator with XRE-family HTH domain
MMRLSGTNPGGIMKIGKRLKALRKEREITLGELSKKTGVALATLSRMENDLMPGTLKSHMAICKVLGVSITDLYRELEDESKTLESVSRTERPQHLSQGHKIKYELLVTRAMDKKLLPVLMHISPGGRTQNEQDKPGVEKFVYVMKGAMEAVVGDKKYTLKQGDSLYFDASVPHKFSGAAKSGAEAITVTSPSTF